MEIFGLILSIVAIITSLGSFGYFCKVSFMDQEEDVDWYQDYFKILGAAFVIALAAGGLGLSVGSGLSRTLGIISIFIMFIHFIVYFFRSKQVQ